MKSLTIKTLSSAAIAATFVAAAAVPATANADYYGYNNQPVTIYFTRHAEKQTTTKSLGDASSTYDLVWTPEEPIITALNNGGSSKGDNLDQVCGEVKCAEELSSLGLKRADLLADWFSRRGITRRLDAVYSSHKERTRQTVAPTADVAGLTVVQLPVGATELAPEKTGPTECPTLAAIKYANPGDTLLIAGHSGTLYDIMGDGNDECEGLGLLSDSDLTSNRFPKDEDGKVADFGDIWKVTVRNGEARFNYRVNLQPKALRISNRAN